MIKPPPIHPRFDRIAITTAAALLAAIIAGPSPTTAATLAWDAWYDSGQVDGVRAVTAGADGTLVLAGSRGENVAADVQVIAYALDGTELWVDTYDGPGGSQDFATAAVADGGDWVYVVGRAAVVGHSDLLTIKYRLVDGQRMWVRLHDVAGVVADEATDVAVGADGSVVVTGNAYTSDEQNDWVTVKYDTDGNLLWEANYAGPGPMLLADDTTEAVAIDAQGDVVVTGSSNDAAGHPDYLTIKYDGATGAEIWSRRYLGAGANDNAYDVAVDDAGDVYVTGISPQPGRLWATLKYDGVDGTPIWEVLDDPGQDEPSNQLILSGGKIFLTGRYDPDGDDGNFNENIHTVARSAADGQLIWSRNYGDIGYNEFDLPSDLMIDAAGRLQVCGATNSFGAARELLLLTYDPADGTELDVTTYDRPTTWYDAAVGVELGPGGEILVGGSSSFDPAGRDALAVMFNGETALATPTGRGAGLRILGLGPNPVSDAARVRFAMPRDATTSVELYDLRGHRVRSVTQRRLVAGEHMLGIDVAGLASGRYFLRLQAGDEVTTRGIVVVR